jgi:2'-5' RNA ligase
MGATFQEGAQNVGMQVLYTLAYPQVTPATTVRLEAIRREHDSQFDRVATHFTLLFGCDGLDEKTYVGHVKRVAGMFGPFDFDARSLVVAPDADEERASVFLVPDNGFDPLKRLHGELYRGPLAPYLRHDLTFVPHITLASSLEIGAARRLCAALVAEGVTAAGSIDTLSVTTLDVGKVSTLHAFRLTG